MQLPEGQERDIRLLEQDVQMLWDAPHEVRLKLAPVMRANVAALLRLLRAPGAGNDAATAAVEVQRRDGELLREVRHSDLDFANLVLGLFGHLLGGARPTSRSPGHRLSLSFVVMQCVAAMNRQTTHWSYIGPRSRGCLRVALTEKPVYVCIISATAVGVISKATELFVRA